MSQPDVTRLTRRQAERVAGVSRATLARYAASGKLSTDKDGHGQNVYDASELRRVFPDTYDLRRLEIPDAQDGVSPDETMPEASRDDGALTVLAVEKRYLTEERDRLREENDRLRRELAGEREKRDGERAEFMGLIRQHQETVRQLTDQRTASQPKAAPATPPPRGLIARLLGR